MNKPSDSLSSILDFFKEAIPDPQAKNFRTQFGCHLEEIAETLEQIESENPADNMLLGYLLQGIKGAGEHFKKSDGKLNIKDRIEFLDGLCDTNVTATGLGYMAGMDMVGAQTEVNRSNLSKFDENGKAILDNNRKVIKGPNYSKPDLKIFV